jgi:uncharacterized membrane protein (DUF2068 family)
MTDAPAESTSPQHEQPAVPAAAAGASVPAAGLPAAHPAVAKRQTPLTLRLIAALALLKTVLTCAAGFFVMALSHHDVAETLNTWLRALSLDPDAELLHKGVAWFAGIPVAKLRLAGVGFFIYAILYLAEAIGLWLDQTWAEWLTIVITGLLIPFEIREMFIHLTVTVVLLFILNVAVVVYLSIRVRRKLRLHHLRKLADASSEAATAEQDSGRIGTGSQPR